MEFILGLLRDVSPGVGLLIAIVYLSRLIISSLKEQQKSNDRYNQQLFELLADFKVALREVQTANSENVKEVVGQYRELKTALDRQTQIISEKLEPVRKIERVVTQTSEQLKQDS